MHTRILPITAVVAFALHTSAFAQSTKQKSGLLRNEAGAFAGYTLFAPQNSRTTYLVDMEGRPVHQWKGMAEPGQSVYLLDNGHLLKCERLHKGADWHGGGVGGVVREYDWNGNLVWEYEYGNDQHCQHHDIEPLPSGNVLLIAWERKTKEEAIQAGRDPELVSDRGVWPDHIVEVKPTANKGGEIVWEWHVWDHLVQDFDETKDNYGSVIEHPELVDINYTGVDPRESPEVLARLRAIGYLSGPVRGGPHEQRPDWNHSNAIDYDPVHDQIILSVLEFHEVWIIDHSTSTAEAASHAGGRWGKGGDLLYRYGNPMAYGVGTFEDQTLFAQHDAHWIERGLPGAGNVLVFNNGRGRIHAGEAYSSIDELALPFSKRSGYQRADTFGFIPAKLAWKYGNAKEQQFFSGHISGAQRLPNGNTLICSGEEARIFEVTPNGKKVWEFISPFQGEMRRGQRPRPIGPRDGNAGPGGDGPKRTHGKNAEQRDRPDRRPRKMPGGPGGRSFRPPHPPPGHRSPHEHNAMFRATRIAPDHPGLKGHELKPIKVDVPATQRADV